MGKYHCYKCNREYDAHEIRFTNTNKFACVYCLGVKPREDLMTKKLEQKEVKKEETIEYICGGCGYNFRRKKSFLVTSCPYCGKEGSISIKKTTTAEKLIKESEDFDF
ncbi:MAG: hypothetical protein QXE31_02755 [Candidatus Woesearchaeota archaeon]